MKIDNTEPGSLMNRLAITQANTAFTINNSIRMMNRKRIFACLPIKRLHKVPIDWPL